MHELPSQQYLLALCISINFERHFKPKQLSNGRIQRDFNTKNTKRLEIHAETLVWEKITFNKKDNMSCGFSKTNT